MNELLLLLLLLLYVILFYCFKRLFDCRFKMSETKKVNLFLIYIFFEFVL